MNSTELSENNEGFPGEGDDDDDEEVDDDEDDDDVDMEDDHDFITPTSVTSTSTNNVPTNARIGVSTSSYRNIFMRNNAPLSISSNR